MQGMTTLHTIGQAIVCEADDVPATAFAGVCVLGAPTPPPSPQVEAVALPPASLFDGSRASAVAIVLCTLLNGITVRRARQWRQSLLPASLKDPMWSDILVLWFFMGVYASKRVLTTVVLACIEFRRWTWELLKRCAITSVLAVLAIACWIWGCLVETASMTKRTVTNVMLVVFWIGMWTKQTTFACIHLVRGSAITAALGLKALTVLIALESKRTVTNAMLAIYWLGMYITNAIKAKVLKLKAAYKAAKERRRMARERRAAERKAAAELRAAEQRRVQDERRRKMEAELKRREKANVSYPKQKKGPVAMVSPSWRWSDVEDEVAKEDLPLDGPSRAQRPTYPSPYMASTEEDTTVRELQAEAEAKAIKADAVRARVVELQEQLTNGILTLEGRTELQHQEALLKELNEAADKAAAAAHLAAHTAAAVKLQSIQRARSSRTSNPAAAHGEVVNGPLTRDERDALIAAIIAEGHAHGQRHGLAIPPLSSTRVHAVPMHMASRPIELVNGQLTKARTPIITLDLAELRGGLLVEPDSARLEAGVWEEAVLRASPDRSRLMTGRISMAAFLQQDPWGAARPTSAALDSARGISETEVASTSEGSGSSARETPRSRVTSRAASRAPSSELPEVQSRPQSAASVLGTSRSQSALEAPRAEAPRAEAQLSRKRLQMAPLPVDINRPQTAGAGQRPSIRPRTAGCERPSDPSSAACGSGAPQLVRRRMPMDPQLLQGPTSFACRGPTPFAEALGRTCTGGPSGTGSGTGSLPRPQSSPGLLPQRLQAASQPNPNLALLDVQIDHYPNSLEHPEYEGYAYEPARIRARLALSGQLIRGRMMSQADPGFLSRPASSTVVASRANAWAADGGSSQASTRPGTPTSAFPSLAAPPSPPPSPPQQPELPPLRDGSNWPPFPQSQPSTAPRQPPAAALARPSSTSGQPLPRPLSRPGSAGLSRSLSVAALTGLVHLDEPGVLDSPRKGLQSGSSGCTEVITSHANGSMIRNLSRPSSAARLQPLVSRPSSSRFGPPPASAASRGGRLELDPLGIHRQQQQQQQQHWQPSHEQSPQGSARSTQDNAPSRTASTSRRLAHASAPQPASPRLSLHSSDDIAVSPFATPIVTPRGPSEGVDLEASVDEMQWDEMQLDEIAISSATPAAGGVRVAASAWHESEVEREAERSDVEAGESRAPAAAEAEWASNVAVDAGSPRTSIEASAAHGASEADEAARQCLVLETTLASSSHRNSDVLKAVLSEASDGHEAVLSDEAEVSPARSDVDEQSEGHGDEGGVEEYDDPGEHDKGIRSRVEAPVEDPRVEDPTVESFTGELLKHVLSPSACSTLTCHLNEHAKANEGHDQRLEITRPELEQLIGLEEVGRVVAAFGAPFDTLKLSSVRPMSATVRHERTAVAAAAYELATEPTLDLEQQIEGRLGSGEAEEAEEAEECERAAARASVEATESAEATEAHRLKAALETMPFFSIPMLALRGCSAEYVDALARWHTVFAIVCQPHPATGTHPLIDLEQQLQCFWSHLMLELGAVALLATAHGRDADEALEEQLGAISFTAAIAAGVCGLAVSRVAFVIAGPAGRVRSTRAATAPTTPTSGERRAPSVWTPSISNPSPWARAAGPEVENVWAYRHWASTTAPRRREFALRALRSAGGWLVAWSIFAGGATLARGCMMGTSGRRASSVLRGWALSQAVSWALVEPAGVALALVVFYAPIWWPRLLTYAFGPIGWMQRNKLPTARALLMAPVLPRLRLRLEARPTRRSSRAKVGPSSSEGDLPLATSSAAEDPSFGDDAPWTFFATPIGIVRGRLGLRRAPRKYRIHAAPM
jgi:hypothetical protein